MHRPPSRPHTRSGSIGTAPPTGIAVTRPGTTGVGRSRLNGLTPPIGATGRPGPGVGRKGFVAALHATLEEGRSDRPPCSDPSYNSSLSQEARQHIARQTWMSRERIARKAMETEVSPAWNDVKSAVPSKPQEPSSLAPQLDAAAIKNEGNALYQQKKFLAAIQKYGCAMEAVEGPELAILHLNRAAAEFMLLNFDGAVRDCLHAVKIDHRQHKAWGRMGHSYVLMEHYSLAEKAYTSASNVADEQGDKAAYQRYVAERDACDAVKRLRAFAAESNVQEASKAFNSLRFFVDDPPLILLRLQLLLQADAAASRIELSRYVSLMEQIIEKNHASDAQGIEHLQLSALHNHLAVSLESLARSEYLCGQHFWAMALAHLRRSLHLRPLYRPALNLQSVMTYLESCVQQANDATKQNRFAVAYDALASAIATDPSNTRLRIVLLLNRADVCVKQSNFSAAISDCSAALECDETAVNALRKRAQCYVGIGDFDRAIADLQRATSLNPKVSEELHELLERRQKTNYFDFGQTQPKSSGSRRPSGTGIIACHYETLGLPRRSSLSDVRAQYKRLILQVHPDKVVGQPQAAREEAERQFKAISAAYSVLSNESLKQQYDTLLR